ncbi:MAG TPA: recombinase family protein [Hymenobacter sp.]|jgi:DNA invertase Pin-like site-specific DNA recombinase
MTSVALFARVSKKSQDTDRQISDLNALATRLGFGVVAIITEKISGSTKTARRPELQKLLELAMTGQIDKVLVTEVSRLGRRTSEVLQVVEQLTDLGVSVYAQTYNLETLTPEGKRNPLARMLFTFLAEFAQLEKETLQDRINSGLEEARRKGKKLGRPAGSTTEDEALVNKYPGVVKLLNNGLSIRKVSKLCDVSDNTVLKVKRALKCPISLN